MPTAQVRLLSAWAMRVATCSALFLASDCELSKAQAGGRGAALSSLTLMSGCWRTETSDPSVQVSGKPKLISMYSFCFQKNGRALGHYFFNGYAGESGLHKWRLTKTSILKIDADLCIVEGHGRASFLLSGCLYEGRWNLECRKPERSRSCLIE